jgi:hypothetical protein
LAVGIVHTGATIIDWLRWNMQILIELREVGVIVRRVGTEGDIHCAVPGEVQAVGVKARPLTRLVNSHNIMFLRQEMCCGETSDPRSYDSDTLSGLGFLNLRLTITTTHFLNFVRSVQLPSLLFPSVFFVLQMRKDRNDKVDHAKLRKRIELQTFCLRGFAESLIDLT